MWECQLLSVPHCKRTRFRRRNFVVSHRTAWPDWLRVKLFFSQHCSEQIERVSANTEIFLRQQRHLPYVTCVCIIEIRAQEIQQWNAVAAKLEVCTFGLKYCDPFGIIIKCHIQSSSIIAVAINTHCDICAYTLTHSTASFVHVSHSLFLSIVIEKKSFLIIPSFSLISYSLR